MKKIIIYLFTVCMFFLFTSCSQGQCPTTNKRYFYRGVPKSKPLYKGYRAQKGYIVPYKYTRKIPNYGKIK